MPTETKDSHEAKPTERSFSLLVSLKNTFFGEKPDAKNTVSEELKGEAATVIDAIQHMLDGNKLDDTTTQKLSAIITKIKSALDKGTLARGSLAVALSDAKAAVNAGEEKAITEKQKTERLWQKVEADNSAINDDFEKMRNAGINFSDGLWNRHKELSEYLKAHPRDIAKQKELDAVDDVLLHQAEPQIKQHPEAQNPFDDAKKKSDDRHEIVDQDLAGVAKKKSIVNDLAMADFDETPSKIKTLSLNDVTPPTAGQKLKSTGRLHG